MILVVYTKYKIKSTIISNCKNDFYFLLSMIIPYNSYKEENIRFFVSQQIPEYWVIKIEFFVGIISHEKESFKLRVYSHRCGIKIIYNTEDNIFSVAALL